MYLINADRTDARAHSFLCEEENGLVQGIFLEIVGMATNNHWMNGDDFNAYKVQLATASTDKSDLLIHYSVPNMYDERKFEQDFILEKDAIGRGFEVVRGDEWTIANELLPEDLVKGDKLCLGANGKLVKVSADEKVIATVIKVGRKLGVQESTTIRFK